MRRLRSNNPRADMELIFVFGSNLAGRHGKGAALHAKKVWGAAPGVGEGLTGRAYALPTKDRKIQTRPLSEIDKAIERFIACAHENQDKLFLLTPVGCGLAGYKARDVGAMVRSKNPPKNVVLSTSWLDHFTPAGGLK